MATDLRKASTYGEAVDLAKGFYECWTYDGPLDAVEEWARQLRAELNALFVAAGPRGETDAGS